MARTRNLNYFYSFLSPLFRDKHSRFLSKFVMDAPWVYVDIVGQDEHTSDKGYNPKGSRGPAVRLIIDLLRYWR